MRDRQAYRLAKRNDPLTVEQKHEHPYDFVSLPAAPAHAVPVALNRFRNDLLYGRLDLVYRLETHLHVGSGVFDLASAVGLEARDPNLPLRGILRSEGRPILPGASFKGAVRTRYEAITRSRPALAGTSAKEKIEELPGPLRASGVTRPHWVEIRDPRLERLRTAGLTPADSLFGSLGHRGRLAPCEGQIEVGGGRRSPFQVPPLESPRLHRLAKPGKAQLEQGGSNRVLISEIEGRKFYYDGKLLNERIRDGQRIFEFIDYVPAGSHLTIAVHLLGVTARELGAFLIAAGLGENVGILRFGGFKPAGLGKVALKSVGLEVRRGHPRTGPRVESQPAVLIAEALSSGFVDRQALAELDSITKRRRETIEATP